jgi:hypothetical protein
VRLQDYSPKVGFGPPTSVWLVIRAESGSPHRTHSKLLLPKIQCNSNSSNSCRRCHSLHSNYMLNRGYAYTTIISRKWHGQALLSHLSSLYSHSTPQAWQERLNNGEVTLNGVTVTESESLTLGQTLVWNRPPWIEPDAPQHFEVLFEDPNLLAVNKPRGLPTLPSGGFWKTPSCAWCKSKPLTQTLSTGWAEPPPASSSSPKHRRPHLIYPEAGTHPKFKKSTGRWLRTLHSTTPTKSSHPSASYRTRSSVPCGPPPQVANHQTH